MVVSYMRDSYYYRSELKCLRIVIMVQPQQEMIF